MQQQAHHTKSTMLIYGLMLFYFIAFNTPAFAQFTDEEVESPILFAPEPDYAIEKNKRKKTPAKNIDPNHAFIHQFGFMFTNAAYAPEAVYNQQGNVFIKPTWHYGFEFAFEYNFLFFKKFGITSEFILGFLPINQVLAHRSSSFNDSLIYEHTTGKDFLHPRYEVYQFDPAPYYAFRIGATYMANIGSKLIIQPKVSALFPRLIFGSVEYSKSSCDNGDCNTYYENYGDCTHCYHPSLPDLTLGVDFQIRVSKHRQQFVLLGLVYNQSFITRFDGSYVVQNVGEGNNSSGNYAFNSTYMGLKLGFIFHKMKPKPSQRKLIFNPRF